MLPPFLPSIPSAYSGRRNMYWPLGNVANGGGANSIQCQRTVGALRAEEGKGGDEGGGMEEEAMKYEEGGGGGGHRMPQKSADFSLQMAVPFPSPSDMLKTVGKNLGG
jgi:hypothetical protein